MQELSTEIFYLFLTTLFCGVLWIPYVTERFLRLGIKETCGYKDNTVNISQWAVRAKLAHFNLVENLILFGILVFILSSLDLSNEQTQIGSSIFFYSRLLHYFCYLFRVPWLRTGFFLISWIGLLMISLQILIFLN